MSDIVKNRKEDVKREIRNIVKKTHKEGNTPQKPEVFIGRFMK